MARYFFHLCDGHEVIIDPEGRVIADAAEIGDFALREARAMISQDALTGRINFNQRIEVRNEDGRLVHRLEFRDAVSVS